MTQANTPRYTKNLSLENNIAKCIKLTESNWIASLEDPRGIDPSYERSLNAINNNFVVLNENLEHLKVVLDNTLQGDSVPARLISALLHTTASIDHICYAAICLDNSYYWMNSPDTYVLHPTYVSCIKEIYQSSVVNRDIERLLKQIRLALLAEGFPVANRIYGRVR